MDLVMSNSTQIEQITERVERLLLRYEELQRTNALLVDQVSVLTQERDSLQSRLSAARSRVEALLERLPETNFGSTSSASGTSSTSGANGADSMPHAKTPAGTER
jgi:cell division protein ZapB